MGTGCKQAMSMQVFSREAAATWDARGVLQGEARCWGNRQLCSLTVVLLLSAGAGRHGASQRRAFEIHAERSEAKQWAEAGPEVEVPMSVSQPRVAVGE